MTLFLSIDREGSKNCYCARCEYCEKMVDGKPNKLKLNVLHQCTLNSKDKVEFMSIVEDGIQCSYQSHES